MPKKTQGVENFVSEVLETISRPYSEDVIEDVWIAIEQRMDWLEQYNELVHELRKNVVNQWIPKYTKQLTGLETLTEKVGIKRSKITETYTKLDINNF